MGDADMLAFALTGRWKLVGGATETLLKLRAVQPAHARSYVDDDGRVH